jgi:uncharacterized DUF497 family protein
MHPDSLSRRILPGNQTMCITLRGNKSKRYTELVYGYVRSFVLAHATIVFTRVPHTYILSVLDARRSKQGERKAYSF